MEAGHGGAHRPPRNAVAGLGETHQRALEAGRSRKDRVVGQAHVVEHQFARVRRQQRELALLVAGAEAGRVGRHDEAANALRVAGLAGLRPDHRHVGHRAVGDPHLGAVEHPAVGGFAGSGDHARRIRPVVGLGEAEAADLVGGGERGQPGAALLFAPEGVDGIHDQRALHRRERANARVAALQLLHDEPVGDVVQPPRTRTPRADWQPARPAGRSRGSARWGSAARRTRRR